MNPLEALTYAIGKEIQEVGGRPVTRLRADLAPSDTTAQVETILGFDVAGYAWAGGIKLHYTGQSGGDEFTGVDTYRSATIARGTYVVSAVRDLRPPAYELFWPNSQAAADFYEI